MCEWMQMIRVALRAAGISTLALGAAAVAPIAFCNVAAGADEDSVLIVTRQAASDEGVDEDYLAPIAANSDRTPDLAEGVVAEDETESVAEDKVEKDVASDEVPLDVALAELARAQKEAAEAPAEEEVAAEAPNPLPVLPEFEPAKFNGIQPGTTTYEDLMSAWGEPDESITTSEGAVLTYHTEPFEAIDVLVTPDDAVAAVKVELAKALESKLLAEQLSLTEIEAVTVTNTEGEAVGQSFPERGVLFMFDTSLDESDEAATVTHVVIQPLDAKAFALRAEQRPQGPYEKNIRDLQIAITVDPELSEAQSELAEIYLVTGQADLADAAATKALELDPENGTYVVRKSQTLQLLGKYDDAVQEVRSVLDRDDVAPLAKAQALHEMARLASLGNADISAKAVSFENKAIEIADHLATSQNVKERHRAKLLLVEAHLGMGSYVAGQAFGERLELAGEWFGRASGLAEAFIANDGGSLELRLLVARQALTTLASCKSTGDPSPWIAEAEETAQTLMDECEDPLWRNRIQWELGDAYLQATKIEHVRRETQTALEYSSKAIANLAQGAKTRQAVHSTEHLVGELYFQIGALHAIHKGDHETAAKWYGKALPLLTSERPSSELYSPRHEGDALVSMGVTYWQVGQKDRALELTEAGAALVEISVEDGTLDKSALAVPYGNLAAIYEHLGKTVDAAKYAELAKTAELRETSTPAPRNSRTSAVVRSRSASRSTPQRQVASSDAADTSNKSDQSSTAKRPTRRYSTARAGSLPSAMR